MSLLSTLLNWLKGKPRKSYQPNDPDLNPIDTDAIKRDIRLEEEAERLGKSGIPSAESTTHSGIETKAIQLVEEARQKYVSWGQERLRVLNQDIITNDITSLANKVLEADTRFEHRADALLSDLKTTLKVLSDNAIALKNEYSKFKIGNRLEREPRYPSPSMKFFLITVLIAFICGEGVLNATFFAQGITGGLLQAFVLAASLSFLNIFVGAMFGIHLIPNVNHVKPQRITVGILGIVLALTVAMTLALLIAHARDALSHDVENPTAFALASLSQTPFELADINSWILFGLSIVFSILAIVDGYKLDDPYPGFGDISRRMNKALDEYVDEMSRVRKDLEDLKEQEIKELEDDTEQIKTRLACLSEAILHKESTGGRLSLAFSNAQMCANTLVKTFQDSNRLHRPVDKPVPAYFGKDPTLQTLVVPSFEVGGDKEKYRQQEQLKDRVAAEKQSLILKIQASFNNKHDALQALDAHFPSTV